MPKKTDESSKSEVVKIRISSELRDECERARLAGARASDAESTFLGYLVAIGSSKYIRSILPVENEDSEEVFRNQSTAGGGL